MDFRLLVQGSLQQKKEIETLITETFAEADTVYNNWNPQSEISQFNRLPAFQKKALSPLLVTLFQQVDLLTRLSEGRFDPTIDPLQRLWKASLQKGEILSAEAIAAITPAVGWSHIHSEGSFYWKDHAQTAVDVGGIAKGYCMDLLIERLEEKGHHNAYVEWGGEVRTIGLHPAGRLWKVGIKGLGAVEMGNGSIATSGDYYQNWEVEGVTYFHIIDPRTATPLKQSPSSIATASVLAPTCTLADGLATTLMLFSTAEEASKWASSLENVQYWLGTR